MLYFVPTPVGNLKDITLRALEVLKSVDVIACEDTRHSLTLLNAYEIKKPLISYHKFNERERAEEIIELIKAGKQVAVISDAGSPVVSDPGSVLAKRLVEENIPFSALPGATAFVPALTLSGLDASRFMFVGFLPEKENEKKSLLAPLSKLNATLIFYSAPHDVDRSVSALYKYLGDRNACAVKEISKLYEKAERFMLKDGLVGDKRGEYVILVSGASEELSERSIPEQIADYVAMGYDKKEAVKLVAKDAGLSKSEVYKYTI